MDGVWEQHGLEVSRVDTRDRTGQTSGKVEASGKAVVYRVADSAGWWLTALDTQWENGERDVSCYPCSDDTPEAIKRLTHGLRLTFNKAPRSLSFGDLWAELRQARLRVKDGRPWSELFSARPNQLDKGAGCSVASELEALGAQVGTRADILRETGRHRFYQCAAFPSTAADVPVVIWVLTRVLPLRAGYAE